MRVNYTNLKDQAIEAVKAIELPVPMISFNEDQLRQLEAKACDVAIGGVLLTGAAALKVWDTISCDRAKAIYKGAWSATKWVAATAWTLTLILIALGMLAIEAYQNREGIKDAIVKLYQVGKDEIRSEFIQAKYWVTNKAFGLRLKGQLTMQRYVVQPAQELKERGKIAAQTLINGAKA